MLCLVTGGAGFIGSNLVDKLIERGHQVRVLDNLSTGKKENINPKADWFNVDITIPGLETLFQNVEVVFHTAAKARVQPSIKNPLIFDRENIGGTVNVLNASAKSGVRRFVYSASSSAYGDTDKLPQKETDPTDPLSPYGLQKMVGEQYCKVFSKIHNIETVSLRYFNVYGERQSHTGAYCLVMGVFARQKLEGKPMTINGDGEQRRDFTYVGDVVEANIKAALSPNVGNGEVINVGNGDNRSVNQIADMLGGERINLPPVVEPFATLADNSLAKKLLDWEPTVNLEDWIEGYKRDLGI